MRINLSSLFKTVTCVFSCGESETSLFPVMYKTQLSSQSVQLINILLNGFLAAEEWMQKKNKKSKYMKKNMIMCHEMFVFFIVKAEQLFGRGFSVLVVSLDFMIIALLCFVLICSTEWLIKSA